ncbi:MAG: c-type cytochrome, partial [Fimbriimonadales bacterium]|nr:c-type cytochrome [Fimbriimonadales bacterium]
MASLSLKISLTLGSSVLAGTIAMSLLAHRPSQPPTPSSPTRAQGQASPRHPAKIFAASCATCHGANGLGEQPSWTSPTYIAPTIARGFPARVPWYEEFYTYTIRNGHYAGDGFRPAMPAFGKEVISDEELLLLVNWLLYQPPLGGSIPGVGVPPPPRPKGREILLEILDEAPWFHDDGTDARDPANDRRRVYLSPNEYIKVVNRGRTWHTVTNKAVGFDTGFIGPSTHIPGQDVGYYYITLDDLPPGAHRYICILHPYMQVEIITPSHDGEPLTHATKLPLSPPPTPGIGEIWVGLQSWKNEQGPDGAAAVINAEDWTYRLIPNVGNNPHNGWMGTALTPEQRLQTVAVFTSWHDSRAVVVDAETYQVLGSFPVGAAPAHVMTAPARRGKNEPDRWFVTMMGSNKVQEIEPILDLSRAEPDRPAIGQWEAHR